MLSKFSTRNISYFIIFKYYLYKTLNTSLPGLRILERQDLDLPREFKMTATNTLLAPGWEAGLAEGLVILQRVI